MFKNCTRINFNYIKTDLLRSLICGETKKLYNSNL